MVPELEHIENMFVDVRESGTNIDGDLRWTFCFLDTNPDRLEKYAEGLVGSGFVTGALESNDASTVFRVCVSQVLTHTPSTLFATLGKFQTDVEAGLVEQLSGIDMRQIDGD